MRAHATHQLESTCKYAGATVLKRMPTYAETVAPLKAKLKGLEIDMHGCCPCCRVACDSMPANQTCSEVTGRGTAGHVARIVQEHALQPSSDSKVVTVTEEWLQVPARSA